MKNFRQTIHQAKNLCGVALLCGASILGLQATAQANPGDLDLSFGTSGKVVTDSAGVRPHKFDFDGNGKDDLAVVRSEENALVWYFQNDQSGFNVTQWGVATDKPAPADYDGDGKVDVAVFRAGVWHVLQSSNNSLLAYNWGMDGDKPYPADYDGDGKADFAVVRTNLSTDPVFSETTWYIAFSNGGTMTQQFGNSTDIATPADYDGDGKTEVAVFRPEEGRWYLSQNSGSEYTVIYWGTAGDKPVVADYDNDGKADPAVFRSAEGVWYIKGSASGEQYVNWGLSGDQLVPADYDGDGKADVAVVRDGVWYVMQSSTSQMSVSYFGNAADQPIPTVY